jgi:hypothetical protein
LYRKLDLLLKASLPGALLLPLIGLGYYYLIHPNRNVGYAPVQPIPFSHQLHAGKLKIDCQYCHHDVSKSTHSNIPSMDLCIGCHARVQSVANKESIIKLKEHYARGEPIQWVNIHDMPDHVRFNHEAHIRKGVSCNQCHGEIENMDVVYQHAPLHMGWCVNCHRDEKHNAPINCSTCHH